MLTYTVGILNYNTQLLLLENLGRSLANGIPARSLLVLDNNSTDGSAEAARKKFPAIRIEKSPVNLGYAGGMNKIVELSETDVVVLVTADCFITLDAVGQLVAGVESEAGVAVAGCRVIDNRTGKIQSEGADITFPLGIPISRNWLMDPDTPKNPSSVECAYVQGAAMVVHAGRFRLIGGFDDSYFAYHEEADLCWRARLRGYRVVAIGSAVALHSTFGSFGKFPEKRWLLSERNRIATNIKNLEVLNLLVSLLYETLYFLAITVGSSFYRLAGYRLAYYKGLVSLVAMRRTILEERKKVQRGRQRTDEEILRLHPRMGLLALIPALLKRLTIMGL